MSFLNSFIRISAKLLGFVFKNLDNEKAALVDTSPNLPLGGSLTWNMLYISFLYFFLRILYLSTLLISSFNIL